MPVGVQCPISSSLGEFPSYWDWLWCPELSPVLVSIAFPFAFHILVFPIRSYLPLDFNRVSSLRPKYRHPFGRPFTYSLFRRVSRFGTGSGTRCCGSRGGQRCAWSRKLDPNFCSGRGRTSDLGIRLPRTPHFSRLLRHAGGYSRTILTPNLQGSCSRDYLLLV